MLLNATLITATILIGILSNICCAQFDLNECFKNKSCIFYPSHCEQNGNCKKIISFAPQLDGWTIMELFYNGTSLDTNYAAVGFSEDDQMGEDAVTHCGLDDSAQVGAFLSRNIGKHNQPINLTSQSAVDYVELLQASRTPNSVYCKFRQKIIPDEAGQNLHVPNLNQTYHLLLAYGKTDNPGVVSLHLLDAGSDDFPTVISTPVNVAALVSTKPASTNQSSSSKRLFVLLHGMLMLLSWLWLVASAITAARYLREHWLNYTPFGLRIWFHMHRTMNALAVFVVTVAVLLIFVGKGWRWTGPAVGRTSEQNLSPGSIHSVIGAVAVGLMLAQPIGALLRCDHGSKYRSIFNWSHRIIGLISFVLALISIVLAVIYFHVWAVRWCAILFYIIYLILLTLMIVLAQKASSQKSQLDSAVTYETDGRYYRGEQINVITKGTDNQKTKKLIAAIVMTFIALAALLAVSMVLLIIFS